MAVKNTIDKSEYELIVNEKAKLRNQLKNVNQFLSKILRQQSFSKSGEKGSKMLIKVISVKFSEL